MRLIVLLVFSMSLIAPVVMAACCFIWRMANVLASVKPIALLVSYKASVSGVKHLVICAPQAMMFVLPAWPIQQLLYGLQTDVLLRISVLLAISSILLMLHVISVKRNVLYALH